MSGPAFPPSSPKLPWLGARLLLFAHWQRLLTHPPASPLQFYSAVRQAVEQRRIPGVVFERVQHREGGVLSARREYLRVKHDRLVFDICAAPHGSGFSISWWLSEVRPWYARLIDIAPDLEQLFKGWRRKETRYTLDAALSFQRAVTGAVQEVIDSLSEPRGRRALAETEDKPVMRLFFHGR